MQQRMHMHGEGDGNNKFDLLFSDLQTYDVAKIRNAITTLNTELCMANETMKGLIRPERFVRPLLNQLNNQVDPALMLLASNCMLSLIDLLPEISETIIEEKGLKILEEKGKSFEYIDVAEDCVKLLDKIAENCPAEVWQSGCALHFLNFIDFFDKSVQNIIMDLVKKCIGEFYNLNQWNKQMKECLKFICNKSATLSLLDDSILIKTLECLALLLCRLNECQVQGNFVEAEESSDEDEEEKASSLFDNQTRNIFDSTSNLFGGSSRFTNNPPRSRSMISVQKIYDEMFKDQACIINFMNILNGKLYFWPFLIVNI